MKDILYSFTTTNTGICNALIFLDERRNVLNNLDNYHFNPWKADWIFTKEYKKERKDMIHQIRKAMDYKGEVSDDEDSIIKYDETQDDFNEQILKYNRDSIRVEDKPNIKNEDMPMIDNEEIATGKIIIDEKSEEEIVVPNKIIKRTSLSENKANIIQPIPLNNRFLDNRLYYYNVYQRNKEILAKNNLDINYTPLFGTSQHNLLGDNLSILPDNNRSLYQSSYYNVKKHK